MWQTNRHNPKTKSRVRQGSDDEQTLLGQARAKQENQKLDQNTTKAISG